MPARSLRLGIVLSLVGCGDTSSFPPVIVQDSAGVVIIHSSEPAWRPSEEWHVAPVASLTLGGGDGAEDLSFHEIRSILRLADGRIVVGDGGSSALFYFDSAGYLLQTVGGRGDGPGEFRSLQGVGRLRGDTIYVLDWVHQRITVLDSDGRLVRITSLPRSFASVRPLPDGGWVAAESEGYVGGAIDPTAPDGLQRPFVQVVTLDSEGNVRETIGRFPGPEMSLVRMGGRVAAPPAAFGRVLSTGVLEDEVLVGTGDFLGVEAYREGEGKVRSVRAEVVPSPVTDEDVAKFRGWVLADAPEGPAREAYAAVLAEAEVPRWRAAFTRMILDPSGYLWLSEYEFGDFASGRWHVFAPEGHYLGVIDMPSGLRVHDVGESYVLGTWTSPLGVQSVRLHELSRTDGILTGR